MLTLSNTLPRAWHEEDQLFPNRSLLAAMGFCACLVGVLDEVQKANAQVARQEVTAAFPVSILLSYVSTYGRVCTHELTFHTVLVWPMIAVGVYERIRSNIDSGFLV
jgi:hypothetical protein